MQRDSQFMLYVKSHNNKRPGPQHTSRNYSGEFREQRQTTKEDSSLFVRAMWLALVQNTWED